MSTKKAGSGEILAVYVSDDQERPFFPVCSISFWMGPFPLSLRETLMLCKLILTMIIFWPLLHSPCFKFLPRVKDCEEEIFISTMVFAPACYLQQEKITYMPLLSFTLKSPFKVTFIKMYVSIYWLKAFYAPAMLTHANEQFTAPWPKTDRSHTASFHQWTSENKEALSLLRNVQSSIHTHERWTIQSLNIKPKCGRFLV